LENRNKDKKAIKYNSLDLGQHAENSIDEQATHEELEWAYEEGAKSLQEALTFLSNSRSK